MTVNEIIMTITGAAIFSFLVITVWGKLVNLFGAIGGYIAAMLIPGTMWIINHGVNNHLIKQSGTVWIDMAWAVGIGVCISSKIQGGKVTKAKNTLMAVILSGIIGGYILTIK
jgi:hypothetical protein